MGSGRRLIQPVNALFIPDSAIRIYRGLFNQLLPAPQVIIADYRGRFHRLSGVVCLLPLANPSPESVITIAPACSFRADKPGQPVVRVPAVAPGPRPVAPSLLGFLCPPPVFIVAISAGAVLNHPPRLLGVVTLAQVLTEPFRHPVLVMQVLAGIVHKLLVTRPRAPNWAVTTWSFTL